MAIDRLGKRVITGTKSGRVGIWDVAERPARLIEPASASSSREFFAANSEVLSVALSADGKTLAKGLKDGTVWLLDLNDGSLRKLRHGQLVQSVDFSPDDSIVATASTPSDSSVGGTIKLWERATGSLRRTLGGNGRGHTKEITQIRFSPDGRMLASSSKDDTVRIWDVDTGKELSRTFAGYKGAGFLRS